MIANHYQRNSDVREQRKQERRPEIQPHGHKISREPIRRRSADPGIRPSRGVRRRRSGKEPREEWWLRDIPVRQTRPIERRP
jgi:hypothetical protein